MNFIQTLRLRLFKSKHLRRVYSRSQYFFLSAPKIADAQIHSCFQEKMSGFERQ